MGESRGERIQKSLRDPNYETKRFSGGIVLLLVYFLGKADLSDVKKEKKEVWKWMQKRDKNFYFDFGEDHDPHRPGNFTLEDTLSQFQEIGWVKLEKTGDNIYEEKYKYTLTPTGKSTLLDRVNFMMGFISKIGPNDPHASELVMKYLQPQRNT